MLHDDARADAPHAAQTVRDDAPSGAGPAPPDPEVDAQPGAETEPSGVVTAFAGVLYLVNVIAYLDLPACFAPRWPLGPWATVDVLARALVRYDDERTPDDPIWALLATLDGGAPDALPRAADVPDDYRIPAAWLDQLRAAGSDTTWHWSTGADRLRVWSSDGFVVADVGGVPGATARDVLRLLAAYGRRPASLVRAGYADAPLAPLRGPLLEPLDADVTRWAGLVVPYVRRRMADALGAEPAAVADVLAGRGRIHVTSSHVDLIVALHDASVAVRRAGLDRDPGWRPELGRVVSFHFE